MNGKPVTLPVAFFLVAAIAYEERPVDRIT